MRRCFKYKNSQENFPFPFLAASAVCVNFLWAGVVTEDTEYWCNSRHTYPTSKLSSKDFSGSNALSATNPRKTLNLAANAVCVNFLWVGVVTGQEILDTGHPTSKWNSMNNYQLSVIQVIQVQEFPEKLSIFNLGSQCVRMSTFCGWDRGDRRWWILV